MGKPVYLNEVSIQSCAEKAEHELGADNAPHVHFGIQGAAFGLNYHVDGYL